jgi:D-apionolactonase
MRELQAGPFKLKYDQGFVRHVIYGETEILRMIYFALRDHNWGTLPYRISDESINQSDRGFRITYKCTHHQQRSDIIHWNCEITGDENGTIAFSIDGTVLQDFRKNRAGFCVLHPLHQTMGSDVEVIHDDETVSKHKFPTEIDPQNPFKNIRTLRWNFEHEWLRLDFEGDVFETEDQRNWSDASFKTFCTPLHLPFPAELKKDQHLWQKVRFSAERKLVNKPFLPSHIDLNDSKNVKTVPLIGIAASTETSELLPVHIEQLKGLGLCHYRADVFPSHENWVYEFSTEYRNAFEIGITLEVALHLTGNFKEEAAAFAQLCLQNRVRLSKVLLLTEGKEATSREVIQFIPDLKKSFPQIEFGVGTDYNFTEINRNRFDDGKFDFISYGLHPQEHAFDDLTLVENLEAQFHTVKSSQAIYEETPVHVSPVTLRRRFNPYATNPAEITKPNEEKADPRQLTTFAAGWTFGSICALTDGGAASITFFQTVGKQGIISHEGIAYPVYDVLKMFASLSGKRINILKSTKPLEVQAFISVSDQRLALVNFTDAAQEVRYKGQVFSLKPKQVIQVAGSRFRVQS